MRGACGRQPRVSMRSADIPGFKHICGRSRAEHIRLERKSRRNRIPVKLEALENGIHAASARRYSSAGVLVCGGGSRLFSLSCRAYELPPPKGIPSSWLDARFSQAPKVQTECLIRARSALCAALSEEHPCRDHRTGAELTEREVKVALPPGQGIERVVGAREAGDAASGTALSAAMPTDQVVAELPRGAGPQPVSDPR